ncbi:unnamed protein product, partial [Urochloa humidicola]
TVHLSFFLSQISSETSPPRRPGELELRRTSSLLPLFNPHSPRSAWLCRRRARCTGSACWRSSASTVGQRRDGCTVSGARPSGRHTAAVPSRRPARRHPSCWREAPIAAAQVQIEQLGGSELRSNRSWHELYLYTDYSVIVYQEGIIFRGVRATWSSIGAHIGLPVGMSNLETCKCESLPIWFTCWIDSIVLVLS